MSNKNNNGWQNKTAKAFARSKPEQIPQKEVFDMLHHDMAEILDQLTKNRQHRGKYPQYIKTMHANICTAKFLEIFVNENVDTKVKKGKVKIKSPFNDDELISLRSLIAEGFRKNEQGIPMEEHERKRLLGKAYEPLAKEHVRKLKKIGMDKDTARRCAVYIGGDPIHNLVPITHCFRGVNISDEKLVKVLRGMYDKDRWYSLLGTALCSQNTGDDTVAALTAVAAETSKKKLYRLLRAYAEAFRVSRTRGMRVDEILERKGAKGIVKQLIKDDYGYRKAFVQLTSGTTTGPATPTSGKGGKPWN